MNEPTEQTSMPLARWLILGFAFWVTFLLVLDPDNVARALRGGQGLAIDRELLRIPGAACVRGSVTPLVAPPVGPRAHLVRETLAKIQQHLVPTRFVRIHRRASRSHRKAIRDHCQRRILATSAANRSP